GRRDRNVTGVQTCALPISAGASPAEAADLLPALLRGVERRRLLLVSHLQTRSDDEHHEEDVEEVRPPHPAREARVDELGDVVFRSEERRVGREWRWGESGE